MSISWGSGHRCITCDVILVEFFILIFLLLLILMSDFKLNICPQFRGFRRDSSTNPRLTLRFCPQFRGFIFEIHLLQILDFSIEIYQFEFDILDFERTGSWHLKNMNYNILKSCFFSSNNLKYWSIKTAFLSFLFYTCDCITWQWFQII